MIPCEARYGGLTWPATYTQMWLIATNVHGTKQWMPTGHPKTLPASIFLKLPAMEVLIPLSKLSNGNQFAVIMTYLYSKVLTDSINIWNEGDVYCILFSWRRPIPYGIPTCILKDNRTGSLSNSETVCNLKVEALPNFRVSYPDEWPGRTMRTLVSQIAPSHRWTPSLLGYFCKAAHVHLHHPVQSLGRGDTTQTSTNHWDICMIHIVSTAYQRYKQKLETRKRLLVFDQNYFIAFFDLGECGPGTSRPKAKIKDHHECFLCATA